MIIHPVKKVHITQEWGVNYQVYVRFGLKGHNGVDYRLYNKNGIRATTAEVFAPHHGKIIETGYDAKGYGYYIKLENNKEGSILAHLKKDFIVKVGDVVKQGELIAMANNSGLSTGAHLHWGYYPIPRIRDNGYSGTVNQLLLMKETPPVDGDLYKQSLINAGYITRPDHPYNDDELNELMRRNVNQVKAGQATLTGDHIAREYWLKKWGVPKVIVKTEIVEKIVTKEPENTETGEKNKNWQSQLDTANAKYKELVDKKVEDYSSTTLLALALKKLLSFRG